MFLYRGVWCVKDEYCRCVVNHSFDTRCVNLVCSGWIGVGALHWTLFVVSYG